MIDNCIIDTSIIVYAHDILSEQKRIKCLSLITSIFEGKSKAHISNQIIAELYHVLTDKIAYPLSESGASCLIDSIIKSDNWNKINYTHKTLQKAIEISKDFSVHFWDALIAATMIENNITSIITENESDFKKIPYIKVINPLRQK